MILLLKSDCMSFMRFHDFIHDSSMDKLCVMFFFCFSVFWEIQIVCAYRQYLFRFFQIYHHHLGNQNSIAVIGYTANFANTDLILFPDYSFNPELGSYYKVFKDRVSWERAYNACAADSAYLVEISSKQEDTHIHDLMVKCGKQEWWGWSGL